MRARLVRFAPLAAALALAACASGGTSTSAPRGTAGSGGVTEQVAVGSEAHGGAIRTEIHGTASVTSDTLAMSVERAWAVLPAAFQGLGLQVTRLDPATHTIEGQILRSRRGFGGKTFGQLLDCGDVAGVPNAGRSDISMTVVSTLVPRGDRAGIDTEVRAIASPMSTNASPSRCTATSGVARIVLSRVREAAAK